MVRRLASAAAAVCLGAAVLSCLASCTTAVPRWRGDALTRLNRVREAGGDLRFPAEYASAASTLEKAEGLNREREVEEAERYYRIALLESEYLERRIAAERAARAAEEARRQEDERLRLETERREEADRLARDKVRAEQAAQVEAQARRAAERTRPPAVRPLAATHTVKRGETLPQISSLPEIYGDTMLWPLLYRANRDQIRDPRHLWPGQVLRIPRNASRDDLAEARRYAQDKPLH